MASSTLLLTSPEVFTLMQRPLVKGSMFFLVIAWINISDQRFQKPHRSQDIPVICERHVFTVNFFHLLYGSGSRNQAYNPFQGRIVLPDLYQLLSLQAKGVECMASNARLAGMHHVPRLPDLLHHPPDHQPSRRAASL